MSSSGVVQEGKQLRLFSERKRGPAATGSVEPCTRDGKPAFRALIRLVDSSRVRVDVPLKYCVAAGGRTARERAKLYAQARQEREDETHELFEAKRARAVDAEREREAREGESSDSYFKRFQAHKKASGKVRRARDLEGAWNTWISPRIGRKPIAGVTRDDIEDIRNELDEQVARRKAEGKPGGLSGARARNIWSVLTSLMKEACSSKRRELRVRVDNPCANVQPPEKTDARKKTFIYPSEFLRLVSCEAISLAWRELYAIACYLYLRPGELRCLLWSDVDFAAGVVHVTKAYDEDEEVVKAPKTRNGVRDVPIPPTLLPLLHAMHERADGEAASGELVVPFMAELNENRRSIWMRDHLEVAKLSRARLFEDTATTMPVNFRSCRDTGITWLALQGVDVTKIQRRAGHDDPKTTLGYVKLVEDLTGTIGEPFPPLPSSLVEAPTPSRAGSSGGGSVHPAPDPVASSERTLATSAETTLAKPLAKTIGVPYEHGDRGAFKSRLPDPVSLCIVTTRDARSSRPSDSSCRARRASPGGRHLEASRRARALARHSRQVGALLLPDHAVSRLRDQPFAVPLGDAERGERASAIGSAVSREPGERMVVPPVRSDRSRRALRYAFLGPVRFRSASGDRPMAITWELETAMPAAVLLFDSFATFVQT